MQQNVVLVVRLGGGQTRSENIICSHRASLETETSEGQRRRDEICGRLEGDCRINRKCDNIVFFFRSLRPGGLVTALNKMMHGS